MLNAISQTRLFVSCLVVKFWWFFISVDIIKNDQNLVAKTGKKNVDLTWIYSIPLLKLDITFKNQVPHY